MHHLWRLVGLIIVAMLSSCLDGHEEYWINRDSSGRLEARYLLPSVAIANMGGEAAMRTKIENYFAGQKTVSMKHLSLSNQQGSVILDIKVEFTQASDFIALLNGGAGDTTDVEPDALDMLLGKMTANREGLSIAIQRDVDIRKLFPQGLFKLTGEQTRDRNLEYIIHLPVIPHTSNAHEITDGGKTLRWNYPLSQALQEPLFLKVLAPIPIPSWIFGIIALLLCGGFFWIWRKTKKRSV